MKRIIFKTVSLIIIFTYISNLCLHDFSFAEEATSSSDSTTTTSSTTDSTSSSSESSSNATTAQPAIAPLSTSPGSVPAIQLTGVSGFNLAALSSFQTQPFTGQATFSIPIEVLPGRKGMQPNITLSYASGLGNGILGVGWSLELGSIERSTKKGVPTYNDSSDTFIFNSGGSTSELVSIGSSGYRAKIEGGFSKFYFDGTFWTVTDKAGTKYYFGQTSSSRQASGSKIFKWYLDKVLDRNGNYLTITYTTFSTDPGQIYLYQIQYTGNETTPTLPSHTIDFAYETRPDTSLNYKPGFKVITTQRLFEIKVNANSKLQRRYHFGYSPSSTNRSLLTSITQYGSDDSTTLPPISFTYQAQSTGWSLNGNKLPDGMELAVYTRVIDVNNDSYPDILKYVYHGDYRSTQRTFLGQKDLTWQETSNWKLPNNMNFGWQAEYWRDDGVQIVDVNGDGWQDIILHVHSDGCGGSCGRNVYINDKTNGWYRDSSWSGALPEEVYFIYNHHVDIPWEWREHMGWVGLDVNGDGLSDFIRARGSEKSCYINTGSGWKIDSNWNMPDGDISNGSTQFADLNADGLLDFFIVDDSSSRVYFNNGSGWERDTNFNINLSGISRESVQIADLNNDGLADIAIANSSTRKSYINTGNGWLEKSEFAFPDGDFSSMATRTADAKGRFLTDILINKSSSENKIYLNNNSIIPDLLTGISNGLGGSITITYKPSAQLDNTGSDGISDLAFPVYIVSSTTSSDGKGNSYMSNYDYKDGSFDFADREFRGFGYTKTTDAEGSYTESYFYQDDTLKGKLYKQETKDKSGNLYAKTENTWYWTEVYTGVYFPYLESTINYIYDGDSSYKRTKVYMEYDQYGNNTKVIEYGDFDIDGDERQTFTDYVYNTSDYILGLPKHIKITDAEDSSGKTVSEKWLYYDNAISVDTSPTKGLLTKEETWLYNPITQNSQLITQKYVYGPRGNLTEVTDALGRSTFTAYDSKTYTYPIKVTNALGHTVETIYYGINEPTNDTIKGFGLVGQVKSTTDPNNQKTYSIYDTLGRLTKAIGPLDTETNPGVSYAYHLPNTNQTCSSCEYALDSYTNLLLHGNGSDGSNSFTDETAKPVTTYGNAQIDTAQSKFGGASGLFDGDGDYLSLVDSNDWNFGSGDFTIDFWVKFNSIGNEQNMVGQWVDANNWWKVAFHNSRGWILQDAAGGSIIYLTSDSPSNWSTGIWYHIAVVRNGSNFYLFSNGVQVASITVSNSMPDLSSSFYIGGNPVLGQYLNGWIDELRISKGIARWTTNFSPSGIGAELTRITKKIKADYASTPNYLTSYSFYDGLGRPIQTKSPAEDDPVTNAKRQIISDIAKFDARGQVKEKYFPYFVNESSNYETPTYSTPKTSFTYDPVGRLTQTTNPDTTYSQTIYDDWTVTSIDEESHVKKSYLDAYGKIVKVEEYQGKYPSHSLYATTNYTYDTLGNLTKVTDNQNNATQIWYDSLGRKIKMDDPDMGIWTYDYDNVGNLTKQTDAKLQVLTFTYDKLNRLTQKQGLSPQGTVPVTLATYYYDTGSYGIGRLSKITDLSGQTEFFYDQLGREIKSIKTVDGSGYTVERTYDALDRLVTLKYPDGESANYTYNPQGIESVKGLTPQGSVPSYVTNIDYSATGQITKIKYGNGTETNYTYDPNNLRLTNLITQSPTARIQDLAYKFDNIGNIKDIIDGVNTATQSFLYDDLDRLIQAQGSYGTSTYTYDPIGNMTSKEGITLTYGKNGKLPHAVTQYGSTLIDYDPNGSMIKKGNSTLSYDVENRLTKVDDKPTLQPTTLTITLSPGWNFFSLPFSLSDSKISSVLSSIAGKYDQVSRYNETTKKFEHYVGNSKYDQFSTFEYGKGYQIYITSSSNVTLSITGSPPNTNQSLSLKTGVNLIFCPTTSDTDVEAALSPLKIGTDYLELQRYDKASNKFQEYSSSLKEFTKLKPGEAYYLYCSKDLTWTISSTTNQTTTFTYDGDGGRVKKVAGIDSTTYIGSLYEKLPSSNTVKHIYMGSQRICAVESTGNYHYYHTDHLGSSNIITDKTGKQTSLTEYTPYGKAYKHTGTVDPKYKFTGKELDSTGLYFYGARYYDPELGRFITADTIVQAPYDPQSLNRYTYCRNNPINLVDPTGHKWSWKKFWKSFAGAFVGVALAFVLGPAGLFWMGSTMAGIIGGAAGGALTGGLEGGWKGALIGAGMGAVLGGIGGWAVGGEHYGVLAGMFVAGAGVAGATNSWDSFAGGLAGALAAGGIASGFKEQFANYRAGNGFRSNAAVRAEERSLANNFKRTQDALKVDAGKDFGKAALERWDRRVDIYDTVGTYNQFGSQDMKSALSGFRSVGGMFEYDPSYQATAYYYEPHQIIAFGRGNWENPWPGYSPGKSGLERSLPHEIYHFMHHDPYRVEEPLAHSYARQQQEILKQNRGW